MGRGRAEVYSSRDASQRQGGESADAGREKHCSAGPTRAALPETGVILYRNVNTEFILKK